MTETVYLLDDDVDGGWVGWRRGVDVSLRFCVMMEAHVREVAFRSLAAGLSETSISPYHAFTSSGMDLSKTYIHTYIQKRRDELDY